jgi:hypothetical protein
LYFCCTLYLCYLLCNIHTDNPKRLAPSVKANDFFYPPPLFLGEETYYPIGEVFDHPYLTALLDVLQYAHFSFSHESVNLCH